MSGAAPQLAAQLHHEFCRHHRCSGMVGTAIAVRDAIAAHADAPPSVAAIRLRDWAAILTATAEKMEKRA
jgi:hypothetical protein